jgi:biotin carboxyl carrier protein
VEVGDHIDEEAVICIIEAMKVMNEIKAEIAGEVMEILVHNGEAVEFGQPLFLIRVE